MKTRLRRVEVILLLGVGLMLGSGCALKQESAPKLSLAQVILTFGAGVEANEAERLDRGKRLCKGARGALWAHHRLGCITSS